MNPLAILLSSVGVLFVLFGLLRLRKRNLIAGMVVSVLGLAMVGAPYWISFFLASSNP